MNIYIHIYESIHIYTHMHIPWVSKRWSFTSITFIQCIIFFLQKKTILLQKTTSFPKKKRFWSIGLTSANATCFMHVFHELWCINCTNMCIYYTRICAYTYIWIPAYEYIYMNNTYIYMNAYTYIHICTYLECERMEFFTSITFIKSIIYFSAKNCILCKKKIVRFKMILNFCTSHDTEI